MIKYLYVFLLPVWAVAHFVAEVRQAHEQRAQTIWFAPPDNLPRGNRVFGPDFASLFDVNAPWSKALSRIQVFELTPRYTFASSEADLRLVLTFLRDHNIQLAIGMQAVTQQGDCGRGEGYTPANGPAAIVKRFRKLGADIKYVSMDEPFFFGHQSTGPNSCRYDINTLVKAMAPNVKAIMQYFPDAQIGETEPIGARLPPDWLAEFEKYLDAYQTEIGKPLGFVQADISWGVDGWQERLRQLRNMLKRRGIAFGVIFNASEPQSSDEAWISAAVHNIQTYDAAVRALPEQAIFASWTPHPSHLLPETSPGTLTYLINHYTDRNRVGTVGQ